MQTLNLDNLPVDTLDLQTSDFLAAVESQELDPAIELETDVACNVLTLFTVYDIKHLDGKATEYALAAARDLIARYGSDAYSVSTETMEEALIEVMGGHEIEELFGDFNAADCPRYASQLTKKCFFMPYAKKRRCDMCPEGLSMWVFLHNFNPETFIYNHVWERPSDNFICRSGLDSNRMRSYFERQLAILGRIRRLYSGADSFDPEIGQAAIKLLEHVKDIYRRIAPGRYMQKFC